MRNTSELLQNMASVLAQSRADACKTQQFMAQQLNKSVATIRNWESGYGAPNVVEFIQWFDVLGLNPLRYVMNFLYPEDFTDVDFNATDEQIEKDLELYCNEVASKGDKRKLAFCIFGDTGSSWKAQLDMWTINNLTSMRSRVNIAQTIHDNYLIEQSMNGKDTKKSIPFDLTNFTNAITKGRSAAISGGNSYSSGYDRIIKKIDRDD